jgi:uncharacterized membrane protein YuzA (DUF378 family)
VTTLLSTPAKGWAEISGEKGNTRVLTEFVYPLIGLCGLAVFIGSFLGNTAGVGVFRIAMTLCCNAFVSLFGGFFLSSYLINQVGRKWFGRGDEFELCQRFVGYSMVVVFVLYIVSGLLSIDLLRWILQFYTLFVVYEGARTLMGIDEARLTRYTLIASIIILASPGLVGMLFSKLAVALN